jgi:transposase
MKSLTSELKVMVLARGSPWGDLPGVGPVVAARFQADVGGRYRFADRNRFGRSVIACREPGTGG